MAKELISVVEGAQVWFEHQQRLLHQAQPALARGWAEELALDINAQLMK